jgi:hypothetical protein
MDCFSDLQRHHSPNHFCCIHGMETKEMSIEAMKQALEALEEIHHGNMTPMAETNWNKAITALRQAIEQAEKQEPVAWMSPNKERLEFSRKDTVYGSHTIPLYTAPPKREWVGLTQEDIDIAFDDTQEGGGFDDFARAIEAKLKEKNT